MSRFLITDPEGMSTALAWRLSELEGEEVRVFYPKGREHLLGMVEHVPTMEEGLRWLGKNGYVISGDEADMTSVRKQGFKVYGGNAWTQRLENDRMFEMEIAKKVGVKIPNYHKVSTIQEGIDFIRKNPDQYVLKQMGHLPKTYSYVGKSKKGEDVIEQLMWMRDQPEFKKLGANTPFLLQEFIDGIEFATSAFWMYKDWKRDDDGNVLIECNREFKKEGDRDTGRTTGEMATIAKFTTEDKKLFELTVEKFTSVLRKEASDVCINFDCNCGITDEGEVYLMECTPRMGYPICALQEYLMNTKLAEFYADLVDGKQGNIDYKKQWGVVTVLGAGKFPDEGDNHEGSFKDQPVVIPQCEPLWDPHVAPFYIKYDEKKRFYRIADHYEWIAGFSYHGVDIIKTNDKCVAAMMKVEVRAPHMRFDIGKKFVEKELPKLIKMGFLSEIEGQD